MTPCEDSLQPIFRFYEDVPRPLDKLLDRKNIRAGLRATAHAALNL